MKRSLLHIALLLLLGGCSQAHLSSWVDASMRTLRSPLADSSTMAAIDLSLEQEEYLKALNLMTADGDQKRAEATYGGYWPRVLNGLLARADSLSVNRNFLDAGQTYRKILENLPRGATLARSVQIEPEQLHQRIDDCADQLLEAGLRSYREGDLKQALVVWDQINSFHPRHAASQRAINTTRVQLHNLEALPSS